MFFTLLNRISGSETSQRPLRKWWPMDMRIQSWQRLPTPGKMCIVVWEKESFVMLTNISKQTLKLLEINIFIFTLLSNLNFIAIWKHYRNLLEMREYDKNTFWLTNMQVLTPPTKCLTALKYSRPRHAKSLIKLPNYAPICTRQYSSASIPCIRDIKSTYLAWEFQLVRISKHLSINRINHKLNHNVFQQS